MIQSYLFSSKIKFLMFVLLILLLIFVFTIKKSSAGKKIISKRIEVVAKKGDSLWAIAKRIAPNHDAEEVIWYLIHLNGKTNSVVNAGEVLIFDYASIW